MNKVWPKVHLREVLRLDPDRVPVDSGTTYPMVGVLSFGRGLFNREPIENGKTSYKFFYRLKADHIVMSQLFGWEGALALSSEDFAGKFLSPQFPTFLCNETKLDRRFLGWLMRRPAFWKDLGSRTTGMGDRRRTLNPEALFACEIPLPPLAEQQRIVARIDELAAQINEAKVLRKQAAVEAEALWLSSSRFMFGEPTQNVDAVAAVTKLAGFEHTKFLAGAPSGDVILLRAGNIKNNGLNLSNAATIPSSISDQLPRSQLRAGDVVMTFIGAKIGDVTFIPPNAPRLHCGPNVAKLTPKKDIGYQFLVAVLQAPVVQEQIREITKLTAQPSLSMRTIRLLKVPVPPLTEQRRIVAELDALQAQVDKLKRLQAETAAELDAMLPSILDRAFKGEL